MIKLLIEVSPLFVVTERRKRGFLAAEKLQIVKPMEGKMLALLMMTSFNEISTFLNSLNEGFSYLAADLKGEEI